jgi:hypothetical protein
MEEPAADAGAASGEAAPAGSSAPMLVGGWLQRLLLLAREDRTARVWLTSLALLIPALWLLNGVARKRVARTEAEHAARTASALRLAAERAAARAAALAAERPSPADVAAAAAAARAAERAASAARAEQTERERQAGLRSRADAAQAALDAASARAAAAAARTPAVRPAAAASDVHAAARSARTAAAQASQDASPRPAPAPAAVRTPPPPRAPREPLPSPGPLPPASPGLAAQRRLVSEQDAAFAASLAADAAREAAAAAARAAAEREAQRLDALRQRWAAATEPSPDTPDATPLLLRYPDGKTRCAAAHALNARRLSLRYPTSGARVERCFPADATVDELYDAAEALRPAADAPKRAPGAGVPSMLALMAGFPPRELPARGSAEASATLLRAAGVDAGSTVLVVLRSADGS